MALEDIREYFTRHFLGRVGVHRSPETDIPAPAVQAPRHEVETYPMRTHMEVRSPTLLSLQGGLACSNSGFRFSKELVKVMGEKVRRYVPEELAVAKASLMRNITMRNGIRRMFMLPQERANRLQWQKARPKAPGEVVLAWYGPIVADAVIKITLNKHRGTLLIWYNPQSRHFKTLGLFLCRRLGVGSKPEWRWM